MLKNTQEAELAELARSCFAPWEFDQFLRFKLDVDRAADIGDGPFKVVVANAVRHLDQHGRVDEFVDALAQARPRRGDVQEYRQSKFPRYAEAGLRDGKAPQSGEEAGLKQIDRLNLAPVIELRGARVRSLAANGGFQKRIRPELGFKDGYTWAIILLKQIRRVCRIDFSGVAQGTGFLVGPDLVLTCQHVLADAIKDVWPGDRIALRFDFQRDKGGPSEGMVVHLKRENWCLDSSPPMSWADEQAGKEPTEDQLDHALVQLDRPLGDESIFAGGPTRGWVRVQGSTALKEKASLAIVQHPKGDPVKVALDTESVSLVGARRVRYRTNTEDGSSGSPCFDLDWNLVALHHWGSNAENQGVPMEAIVARLKQKGLFGKVDHDSPD